MAVNFDLSIFMSRVQHLADVLFCPDFNEAFYFLAVPGEPTTHFLCSSGFTSSAVVGSYSFFFYCFDCAVVNRAHYCPDHYSVSHSYESVVPVAGAFVFSLHRNRYRVRMDASRDHLFFGDLDPLVLSRIRARLLCSHMPKRTGLSGGLPTVSEQLPQTIQV